VQVRRSGRRRRSNPLVLKAIEETAKEKLKKRATLQKECKNHLSSYLL